MARACCEPFEREMPSQVGPERFHSACAGDIAFAASYYGCTLLTLGLTGKRIPHMTDAGHLPAEILRVPL